MLVALDREHLRDLRGCVSLQLTIQLSMQPASMDQRLLQQQVSKEIKVTKNSLLEILQIHEEWKIKEDKSRSYFQYAKQLMQAFKEVELKHVSRLQNQLVDALATFSFCCGNSDKKIMQLVVLIKSNFPSYEGSMITYLELEDNEQLKGIRRYL